MLPFLRTVVSTALNKTRLAPATIRLTPEKHHELSAIAFARGITLAELLRERLDLADPIFGALANLQQEVSLIPKGAAKVGLQHSAPAKGDPASDAVKTHAILIEILLLMRAVAGPDRLNRARAEMARQGLQFWTGEVA